MIDVFAELNEKLDLRIQTANLDVIFRNDTFYCSNLQQEITLMTYFNQFIVRRWNFSILAISYNQLLSNIKLNFSKPSEIDENKILRYCQIMRNILTECFLKAQDSSSNTFVRDEDFNIIIQAVLRGVEFIADKLGYQFLNDEKKNYLYISKKNILASKTSNIVTDVDLALKIYEYNYLDNDKKIEKKQEILKALANYVEPILKNSEYSKFSIFNDIIVNCRFALNNLNLRHNNIDKDTKDFQQFTKDMKPQELIKWYDKTFDLILYCFLLKEFLDNKKAWEDLRKNY